MIALRSIITEGNGWHTPRYYSPMQITSKGQIPIRFSIGNRFRLQSAREAETDTERIGT